MLNCMTTDKLEQLEDEIRKIKSELSTLGPMRPGTLSMQYKVPAEKKGPYFQPESVTCFINSWPCWFSDDFCSFDAVVRTPFSNRAVLGSIVGSSGHCSTAKVTVIEA